MGLGAEPPHAASILMLNETLHPTKIKRIFIYQQKIKIFTTLNLFESLLHYYKKNSKVVMMKDVVKKVEQRTYLKRNMGF